MDTKQAVEFLKKEFTFGPQGCSVTHQMINAKRVKSAREICFLIETLQAENERLRKIEEKANAVCDERKNIFTNYPNVNHKLTIAFNELQDALKGGM